VVAVENPPAAELDVSVAVSAEPDTPDATILIGPEGIPATRTFGVPVNDTGTDATGQA
jgi:hypothetical protein